jgi:ABC-type uncharacterized transport system substrate-binding protein
MNKKLFSFLFIAVLTAGIISAQSVSQIGFVITKGLPAVENIAVICHLSVKDKIIMEAKTATLVTKRKFHVYTIRSRTDLPQALNSVRKLSKPAVIIIADKMGLNQKSVKYTAQKLGKKKIPVISNREGDCKQGALLGVIKIEEDIKIHINKVVASALKIEISEEFLATCIIDVE